MVSIINLWHGEVLDRGTFKKLKNLHEERSICLKLREEPFPIWRK